MKKSISLLLALVMIISMIPLSASAGYYPEPLIEDSAIRDFYNYAFTSTNTYNFCIDENGKEDWTSPNLQPGYGSFEVKRGEPVYDYGVYRIKYMTTVYQPQEYKNIKIEYSNPGVVNVDTSGISSGYMELKFEYVSEGTTDITITYTVGKCWNTNNGPGYNEDYLNKTAQLIYKDVKSTYVPVDKDGDGIDDLDGTCLHEKDEEGYCLVDGCVHNSELGLTCCPKRDAGPVDPDPDGDGFDEDGNCLHEKDGDGYCTVEGCVHPEDCCPKKATEPEYPDAPDGPLAEQIWISNMGGYYITVKCATNTSHTAKIAIKNHNKGLIVGDVVPNTGDNADTYPWVCYVEPNGEYFMQYAIDNYDLNKPRYTEFDHYVVDVEGAYFYSDGDGYWFRDQSASNTMMVNVNH